MDIESRKVLIVEDDMIISMVLEKMVTRMDHKVVGNVATGRKAIELARTHVPDLILMDIQLKGDMDGITAMQEIRKDSEVAVIYITGNSDSLYMDRAKKTCYVDYLVKPIQMEDLKKSIHKAFAI